MNTPFPPPLAEAAPSAPVRADLAVQLTGWHVAETVEMARRVLMVLPSARLNFAHPQPIRAALSAWGDAERLAADVLPQSAAIPPAPQTTVSARVLFGGPVGAVHIDALPARTSSSGAAQVRVRLGALLIIAADRDAVACQLNLWQAAARHADRLWPAAPDQPLPCQSRLPAPPADPTRLERSVA